MTFFIVARQLLLTGFFYVQVFCVFYKAHAFFSQAPELEFSEEPEENSHIPRIFSARDVS